MTAAESAGDCLHRRHLREEVDRAAPSWNIFDAGEGAEDGAAWNLPKLWKRILRVRGSFASDDCGGSTPAAYTLAETCLSAAFHCRNISFVHKHVTPWSVRAQQLSHSTALRMFMVCIICGHMLMGFWDPAVKEGGMHHPTGNVSAAPGFLGPASAPPPAPAPAPTPAPASAPGSPAPATSPSPFPYPNPPIDPSAAQLATWAAWALPLETGFVALYILDIIVIAHSLGCSFRLSLQAWLVPRAVIVLALLVDLMCAIVSGGSLPRFALALRPLLLMSKLRNVRKAFQAIVRTLPYVSVVLVLMLLNIATFGFMGIIFLSDNPASKAYATLGSSLYHLLLIAFSLVQLPVQLAPYFVPSPLVALFFASFAMVHHWFLVKLLVAISYKTYKSHCRQFCLSNLRKRRDALVASFLCIADVDGGHDQRQRRRANHDHLQRDIILERGSTGNNGGGGGGGGGGARPAAGPDVASGGATAAPPHMPSDLTRSITATKEDAIALLRGTHACGNAFGSHRNGISASLAEALFVEVVGTHATRLNMQDFRYLCILFDMDIAADDKGGGRAAGGRRESATRRGGRGGATQSLVDCCVDIRLGICYCFCCGLESLGKRRRWLRHVVEDPKFIISSYFLSVASVVQLYLRNYYGSASWARNDFASGNFLIVLGPILLIVFTVELLVKLFALGRRDYWADVHNRVDFFCVLTSWALMLNDLLGNHQMRANDHVVSHFALVLRLFRALRLCSIVRPFREVVWALYAVLPVVGRLLLVYFCGVYCFGALGMQLYAGLVDIGDHRLVDAAWSRYQGSLTFDDLFAAVTTCFQISLTTGPVVMEAVVDVTSDWSYIYFFTFHVLFSMIYIPVFTGFVLELYVQYFTHVQREEREEAESRAADDGPGGSGDGGGDGGGTNRGGGGGGGGGAATRRSASGPLGILTRRRRSYRGGSVKQQHLQRHSQAVKKRAGGPSAGMTQPLLDPASRAGLLNDDGAALLLCVPATAQDAAPSCGHDGRTQSVVVGGGGVDGGGMSVMDAEGNVFTLWRKNRVADIQFKAFVATAAATSTPADSRRHRGMGGGGGASGSSCSTSRSNSYGGPNGGTWRSYSAASSTGRQESVVVGPCSSIVDDEGRTSGADRVLLPPPLITTTTAPMTTPTRSRWLSRSSSGDDESDDGGFGELAAAAAELSIQGGGTDMSAVAIAELPFAEDGKRGGCHGGDDANEEVGHQQPLARGEEKEREREGGETLAERVRRLQGELAEASALLEERVASVVPGKNKGSVYQCERGASDNK